MLPPIQTNYSYRNFPLKPSTNMVNGVIIGSGISLLIVGGLISFFVNAIYNQQTGYLASEGIQVNTFSFGFDNVVVLISMGALIAMLGIYTLILGCLNQFNPTARAAWHLKDDRARLGNGLIVGGFIFASFTSLAFIRQVYQPINSEWFGVVNGVFVASSLLAIAIGALLIRSAYLRRFPPTKV
jgi:hypothetical protein